VGGGIGGLKKKAGESDELFPSRDENLLTRRQEKAYLLNLSQF